MAKSRHPTLQRLLTVAEAADITGTCGKWVRSQIDKGNLKSHCFASLPRIWKHSSRADGHEIHYTLLESFQFHNIGTIRENRTV
jgi:hypothetical protein